MAYNLEDKLVVAVSSRALFDLEAENEIFEKEGLAAYYSTSLKTKILRCKKERVFVLLRIF